MLGCSRDRGNITMMPSPSSLIDAFAVFDGCAAAGAVLIHSLVIAAEGF